jgi:hypothetical protein
MFQQKFLATIALSLTALIAYSPAVAQEACSCQCIEGTFGAPDTATWACSGFITAPPPAEGCPVETTCPVDPAPVEPVVDQTPVVEESPNTDDQVADNTEAEPPVSGLQCRYRKVYRPDQGKFKKVKVCRLSEEKRAERKERMAAKRAELQERLAEYRAKNADTMARLRAKHQMKIAEWKLKNGKAGD